MFAACRTSQVYAFWISRALGRGVKLLDVHEVLLRALGLFHLSVRVLGCDAFTSSILSTEVLCGALRSLSGSESASFTTPMNASTSSSRSRRLSVSGASTIIASSTIYGKYTVGEWSPKHCMLLPMSIA